MLKKAIKKIRKKISQISGTYECVKKLAFENKRLYLEDKILRSNESGVSEEKYCQYDVIVSLTTYGRRLQDVCFTIESIMQQTMLPNKIVLNLDNSISPDDLPIALKKQQERGLEIAFTEDIRSYKKLIPTLISYPESIIITIDDDLLYDFDVVEKLVKSYLKYPTKISALRVHTITFDEDRKPLKYVDWGWCKAESENPYHLFPTTGGGVLYPPHSFSDDVLKKEDFMSICPTADDVWFYAMAVKKGTEIVKVPTRSLNGEEYIVNEDVQDMGLWQINTGEFGKNDEQIRAVFQKYGLYDLLK